MTKISIRNIVGVTLDISFCFFFLERNSNSTYKCLQSLSFKVLVIEKNMYYSGRENQNCPNLRFV